jgi:ABC-type spermidine/putrescine transport system permease subunit II
MEAMTTTARHVSTSLPARAWAWLRRNALMIYAGLAVAYMLIPIAVIALFSFEKGNDQGELDFAWDGLQPKMKLSRQVMSMPRPLTNVIWPKC